MDSFTQPFAVHWAKVSCKDLRDTKDQAGAVDLIISAGKLCLLNQIKKLVLEISPKKQKMLSVSSLKY